MVKPFGLFCLETLGDSPNKKGNYHDFDDNSLLVGLKRQGSNFLNEDVNLIICNSISLESQIF